MAKRGAVAMLLVAMLVASVLVESSEALTDCGKQCMPVCLREQGATIPVCEAACESYCNQAASSSNVGGFV